MIALVGSYPPPHGGQSVHLAGLFAFLREEGLASVVLNTGSNKKVREPGVVNVASSRRLLVAALRCDARLLHVHLSGVDDYGKLAPIFLAALLRRLPWVATIHAGDSARRLRSASSSRRRASRTMISRAAKVICVNETIRRELATLVDPARLEVIPAFSIDYAETPLREDIAQFVAGHSPIVSCVGFYDPVYGFDAAILALERIRETHPQAGLLLVGDTRDCGPYEALIAARGLGGHVKLCGNLGNRECLTVMRGSALFLRLTQFDGDSVSVREALALGVPVVASDTDFRPEGTVVYRKGDASDLLEKALAALGRGASGGCRPARDRQSLERLRRLYRELLGE